MRTGLTGLANEQRVRMTDKRRRMPAEYFRLKPT